MTTGSVPSPITASSVLIASGDQASSSLGDETVVLDLVKRVYYELDVVGTLIWNLVQEPVSVTAVCQAVAEAFGIDVAQAEQDVVPFLNGLASQGFLTVRDEPARVDPEARDDGLIRDA